MSSLGRRIVLDRATLILVMGVPGSGKTTLSALILERIVATYLDNNFVADAFFAETRTDPEYLRLRSRLYAVLYRITEENLNRGNSVLLDAPHVTQMLDPGWRELLTQLVRRTRASLKIVRCWCDEPLLRARIEGRGELRDEWKLRNWGEFVRREPIDVEIPFAHFDIDTNRASDANVDDALAYIGASAGRE